MELPPVDASIILPVHNEEENIAPLVEAIASQLSLISLQIVLIDDGSTDGSWDAILKLCSRFAGRLRIDGVRLTRNFGKQAAITCGITHAVGEYMVTMDADFQHPPELLPAMVDALQGGTPIVHAIRRDLKHASWFKRWTSFWFTRFFNYLSEVHIPAGVTDYIGFNRNVREAFLQVRDKARFNRAIFLWTGFPSAEVKYDEPPRRHGETKLSTFRLIDLALKSLTQFSHRPLYLAMMASPVVILLTLALFALSWKLVGGTGGIGGFPILPAVVGLLFLWLALVVLIQSLYIGRIFYEIKERPLYVVLESYSNVEQGPDRL
ncbi:MAG: glycosyltransferase family 2 protein [bacterium]|nr:glycosyltransferase family 2 protein [bacterium]